jgi:hypothetical protein
MRRARDCQSAKLEELPNIGKSIAADLRSIGVLNPQQLAGRDPLATYIELGVVKGRRHDPCVLYTLMSVQHFLESGESLPWWTFTGEGKKLLASISERGCA